MTESEMLQLTPEQLVDMGICPTCLNRKHNGALYGDNADKLIYEDEEIECFFVRWCCGGIFCGNIISYLGLLSYVLA